jgi:hypothetical protein
MMKGEEVRAQANAYINSQPNDNITTRNANAKIAGSEITATLFSVKNDLEQLTIERDFLLLLLKEPHGQEEEDEQPSSNEAGRRQAVG